MVPEYGKRYRRYYHEHWWWRAREATITNVLRRYCPPGGWRVVLDVGCGDGLLFDRLKGFADRIEGVEPDVRLLDPCGPHRERIYVTPFDGGFRPGKLYDVILMLDVVEHLADPVAALNHAGRLLKPGGALVITVPALMSLWTNHDRINEHRIRYTRRTFAETARQAGLQLESQRYLFQWTCVAKLLQRLFERLTNAAPTTPSIPPKWINWFLLHWSQAENRIASQLPIPFGSSLLIIAHPTAHLGEESSGRKARAASSD